jgi:hypothetical protein
MLIGRTLEIDGCSSTGQLCFVHKVRSEITEPNCNVKVIAVLFSLGQYVKQKYSFYCRLWNDRINWHYHTYGQGFQEIPISGRADAQHGNEGCAYRDWE